MVTLRELYRGLGRRAMPEQVAANIIEMLGLTPEEARRFPQAPSWRREWTSSMHDDWDKVADLDKPLTVLAELTGTTRPDPTDPTAIRAYLEPLRAAIGMKAGQNSFKNDRLDSEARGELGITMSRRRYDKLFRLFGRLEQYTDELESQLALARLARFAKIGFTADVPYKNFASTPTTAAFVAYHGANLARRSLFIFGPQARAFDAAAEWLFTRLQADPATDWYAVAHTFPREDVLARLTVEQRVTLLEKALAVLNETAARLGEIASTSGEGMNLNEMIVRRGNDSSTWNALAGSWNKARDLWIAISWSLDPTFLDALLPGKVLRLMAADVAYVHRARGGGLDPDTRVWAALPRPWDVLAGDVSCGRDVVIAVCRAAGVDPEKSGWAKPRPRTTIALVQPTPESVHGVVVGHPALATMLRRAGWFSGKDDVHPLTGIPITVERDEHGAAVLAKFGE